MLNGFSSAQTNPPSDAWYRALKSVRTSVHTSPARATAAVGRDGCAAGASAATAGVNSRSVSTDAFVIAGCLRSEPLDLLAAPSRFSRIGSARVFEPGQRLPGRAVARMA